MVPQVAAISREEKKVENKLVVVLPLSGSEPD